MNGPKWTPGPWRTNKYGSVGAGAFGVTPIVAAEIEKAVDMDLIAAAPELAEALQRLITAYEMSHSPDTRRSCWDQARAALRKARGEG